MPLRTEQDYAQRLQAYKEQSNSNFDKTYWDFFKQFSKENALFQSIPKHEIPIYIPTEEEKNDPYLKSIFEEIDLSSLE